MTAIFDGLAGLLADTLGSPVVHRSPGRPDRSIQGMFRSVPSQADGEDGRQVLDAQPVLRACRPDADLILHGDTIRPGDGQGYRVLNRHPSGSPAADAFVTFVLERIQ